MNLIFGFPWETADDYKKLRKFIKKVSSVVQFFPEMYVLTPFPGTEMYDTYNDKYGFKNWWISKKYEEFCESIQKYTPYFRRTIYDDNSIELDFFKYSKEIKREIEKSTFLAGKYNLKKNTNMLEYLKKINLSRISKFMYNINPRFEHRIFGPKNLVKY